MNGDSGDDGKISLHGQGEENMKENKDEVENKQDELDRMMQEVDFTVNLVHIEMSIERSVILNEEDKDGRMILTTDEEERMQRVS